MLSAASASERIPGSSLNIFSSFSKILAMHVLVRHLRILFASSSQCVCLHDGNPSHHQRRYTITCKLWSKYVAKYFSNHAFPELVAILLCWLIFLSKYKCSVATDCDQNMCLVLHGIYTQKILISQGTSYTIQQGLPIFHELASCPVQQKVFMLLLMHDAYREGQVVLENSVVVYYFNAQKGRTSALQRHSLPRGCLCKFCMQVKHIVLSMLSIE